MTPLSSSLHVSFLSLLCLSLLHLNNVNRLSLSSRCTCSRLLYTPLHFHFPPNPLGYIENPAVYYSFLCLLLCEIFSSSSPGISFSLSSQSCLTAAILPSLAVFLCLHPPVGPCIFISAYVNLLFLLHTLPPLSHHLSLSLSPSASSLTPGSMLSSLFFFTCLPRTSLPSPFLPPGHYFSQSFLSSSTV